MAVHVSKICSEAAYQLNLPDYFYQGQIYLALSNTGQADLWPTEFVEVQLIAKRLVVLHASLAQEGWTVTDFLSGGAITTERTKAAAWRRATHRLSLANPSVFDHQVPINTRLFRQSFDELISLVSRATSQTELSGYSSAARAIVDQVLAIHESQLPLVPK